MKKVLISFTAIVFLMGAFLLCGCQQKTLYAYTESGFPPFEYTQDSKINGVDVEIAKALAKKLNMRLVVKDIEFSSIADGLTQNNAIGIGMSINEEKMEKVDFSAPYMEDVYQYVIFTEGALDTDENDMVSPEKLKGKELAVQKGSSADILITQESKEKGKFENAKIRRYDNALTATQDIGHSNDYVIIDGPSAIQIAKNKVGLEAKRIASLSPESYGIAVKKGNQELLNSINNIIIRLIEEGQIEKWLEEHSSSSQEY
ncbi:MAG: ABC transporter substrate-binding protein [Bacillota bacterium]